MEKIYKNISEDLNIKIEKVQSTIGLLDQGYTIPFISRYRKEVTGNLQDYQIRDLSEKLDFYRNLEDKKEEITRLIKEALEIPQGEDLDKSLKESIDKAQSIRELENIYRPYRPKRKTRASEAIENGLQGLASIIINQSMLQEEMDKEIQSNYLNENIEDIDQALEGAKDIIAELISESSLIRDKVINLYKNYSKLTSKAKDESEKSPYETYYDFSESIKTIADHRILAINRGEREGYLKVSFESKIDMASYIGSALVKNRDSYISNLYYEGVIDGFNRLIKPSIEREIRNELTEKAEDNAIEVFGKNLKPLLLQAPLKDKKVLAIDPAFRTGCKIVALNEIGQVENFNTIYPHQPHNKVEESKNILEDFIKNYDIEIIAIGNGTASRETELLVSNLIDELNIPNLSYSIVSEAGASVYSASDVGREEFPDLDVSIRGAISIGRRIQDPLAELVKIEPKHIGVGQYQHDLNQKKLDKVLDGVVEDSVNSVGVNLNTASRSLLRYVSGLNKTTASNIISYRNENGKFTNRNQLKEVKGIGPKTYTQAVGFLRIPDGENKLDNTGVHPESYSVAEKLLKLDYKDCDIDDLSERLDVGRHTLKDIIDELEKPGRDPREKMPKAILRRDILSIEDLKEGMVLSGTIRNIVDFGAFVDLGVGEDGLIHISNISDKHVKNVGDVLSLGDIVEVKIISLDIEKNRIGLSMKDID